MDGVQQLGLPLLGIVAAAAVTFYVISFNELREVSLSPSFSPSFSPSLPTPLSLYMHVCVGNMQIVEADVF